MTPSARHRLPLLAGFYLVELTIAWLLATPFAELSSRLLGSHPDGDKAAFFDPGMFVVYDVGQHHGAAVRSMIGATVLALCVWGAASVLLEAALFAGVAEDGPLTASRLGERTGALAVRMLGIAGIALVGFIVIVIMVGIAPISTIGAKLDGATPRASVIAMAIPVLLLLAVLGIFQAFVDLLRGLCAKDDLSIAAAVARVVRAPRQVLRLFGLAVPRWLCVLGLVGYGAAFSAGSRSIFAIFLVHQAFALGRVVLRGSIVARALRVAGAVPPISS